MRWGARTTEMDKGSSKGDAKEIALVVIPKEIRRQAEARQTQAEVQQSATKRQVSAQDRVDLGLSQQRGRLQGCCKGKKQRGESGKQSPKAKA